MNILARVNAPALLAGLKYGVLFFTAAALLSCGGSDGGVGIGDGQGSDPVVVDFPLFYVSKPVPDPVDGTPIDQRDLLAVQFGADLYMRERASTSAAETNLTGSTTGGLGDIRDLSVSHDGLKVLFAMRFPVDPDGDEEDQPSWNIWEYDVELSQLSRIMQDPVTAGEGDDIAPHYLPDGRIVFSSTRQNRSVAKLTDQGKPQYSALDEDREEPAFVLHVMDDDGSNLVQTSFNQSHDMSAAVLDNGRVMFSRWDHMNGVNKIGLYTANPDGTDMQMIYAAESHDTGTNGSEVQFVKAKELPNGDILSLILPFTGTDGGGELAVIEARNYLNNTQPNAVNQGVLSGPAQSSATSLNVSTEPGISEGGRYADAWPLNDGTDRMLVSWTDCAVSIGTSTTIEFCTAENLADPQAVEATPAYGIWIYDLDDRTLRPIVLARSGFIVTDVLLAKAKARPTIIPDFFDPTAQGVALVNEDAGILHVRSVYDIDGVDNAIPDIATVADPAQTSASQREARFIRIYKAVAIPDEDTLDFDDSAFGVSPVFGMREIVGYAPVEPDGSVMVKVPADLPISIDVLNSQGQRISRRHRHWLQVRPGEVRQCNGCHENAQGMSHGRSDAFTAVNQGAPFDVIPFPNTLPTMIPEQGDTMAMTRVRIDPLALEMSPDLIYTDVWSLPADVSPDYSLTYAAITDTPVPDNFNCSPWTVNCRVVINYETHIQPFWDVSRPLFEDPVDPLLETGNNRCIDCHAFRDPANVIVDPVARGQLELTSNDSGVDNHMVSYRELLFTDNEQELLDPDTVADRPGPVIINGPLSAGSALASFDFFFKFNNPADSHFGLMSPDELRVISEWLDAGAQYYNDPFASVP